MLYGGGSLLVFDCETTGLLKDVAARPIQLAWVILNSDGVEVMAHEALLKSVTDVPVESTAIHGITTEILEAKGVDPSPEIERFFA